MAVEAANDVLTGKRHGVTQATAATPLAELGFDSLEVAELFAAIEDRCGLELDPESVRSLITVGDLAQLRTFSHPAPQPATPIERSAG
jgi:acyl carrier protein